MGAALLYNRNKALAARRSRVAVALKKLTTLLSTRYSAQRIVLIGSGAHLERFGFHSDLDIAVQGIPSKRFFHAAGEALLAAGEFNVDLIPVEDATTRMRETIAKGKILYEKR